MHPFEAARALISDNVKNELTLDHRICWLALAVLFLAPACRSASEGQSRSRTFELRYEATVRGIPHGTKILNLWLPLPQTDRNQTTHRVVIDAPNRVTIGRERDSATRAFTSGSISPRLPSRSRSRSRRLAGRTPAVATS